jgi:hypothetical protein
LGQNFPIAVRPKNSKRRKKIPAKNFGGQLGTTFWAVGNYDSQPLGGDPTVVSGRADPAFERVEAQLAVSHTDGS